MEKKYNIALLPKTKSTIFIALATELTFLKASYCLNKNNSLPHVTLCQFYWDEKRINKLWQQIYDSINKKTLTLNFTHINSSSYQSDIFWLALIPEEYNLLLSLHKKIISMTCTKLKRPYDPHLTLINTYDKNHMQLDKIQNFFNNYQEITDEFYLAIGECDPVGQFTKIIKCFKY